MRNLENLFQRLAESAFRRRFRLGESEAAYLEAKGIATVLEHGRGFIDRRLAPAPHAAGGRGTSVESVVA
jgi:hypothetical protein